MTRKGKFSRRDFLKTAGLAAAGTAIMPRAADAAETAPVSADQIATVPVRPFGKTGVNVSILSLGGMFDIPSNQIVLRQALRLGVTYWDTADCYGYGVSEKGIGKYLKKYPDDRKKIFLVSKSDDRDPKGLSNLLNRSLERMNTDYIDLYFVHGIGSIRELNDDTRKWAAQAKKDKKIRFFGFSTHKNMASCLSEAATLGWIDGIMMTYNYRIMHDQDMREAVDACHKAGIGLTAMKTQGGGSIKTDSDAELTLAGHFVQQGFTPEQAKLLAVWEDTRIASICSQMPNMTILSANAAAAMKKPSLSLKDREIISGYARLKASDYCAGCAEICEPEIGNCVPVADIMRYLMYCRSYGEPERAKAHFQALDLEVRKKMAAIDYTSAEKKCPRSMPIGKLMQEAAAELA